MTDRSITSGLVQRASEGWDRLLADPWVNVLLYVVCYRVIVGDRFSWWVRALLVLALALVTQWLVMVGARLVSRRWPRPTGHSDESG